MNETSDIIAFAEDPETLSSIVASKWKILVVDDEPEVHDVTALALRGVSFEDRRIEIVSARSAAEARAALERHPDVALLVVDVVMEAEDSGLRLVEHVRETLKNSLVRIVLRTGQPGHAPERTVIRDYDIGDYRSKTELTTTRLYTTVVSALRTYGEIVRADVQRREIEQLLAEKSKAYEALERLRAEIEGERDYLRDEVRESQGMRGGVVAGLGSESPAFVGVLQRIATVAKTSATVLLLGESGVGKEVVARAIHESSDRADKPLVKVNCASVPHELFESEFFGHVKGAFTGALRDREGRFQLADGGTLFLDEVGEIPLDLQGKLLRALQEREVERVGDTRPRKVDVRLVAATNRDLEQEVKQGRFRADLFFRLAVFPMAVPPLRERLEDVVPLFTLFLNRARDAFKRPRLRVRDEHGDVLRAYGWPGNVRELQNSAERAALFSPDNALDLSLVVPEAGTPPPLEPPRTSAPPSAESARTDAFLGERGGFLTAAQMRELERENTRRALERAEWKVAGEGGAAELLGLRASTLASQIKALGIVRPERR